MEYKILADVDVTLHEDRERNVVESANFFNSETWMEGHFHATETFNDDVSVWELV
eukprot:CAMPEP_0194532532 /NCGR_PEP_ID=MMETSP0253-20130528/70115_1 /TAXON_ID=2966 /ORGANISM="Noctiluca scintillans" /LENGTH=54 /DNA_ID=CAMNT_0039377987 /DNA_START=25 /DNA_END=186 /DNA_ORIENTATION=-